MDLGEEDLLIQGNNRKVREELKGGLLAKSGKPIFQGRSFLEGKIQKKMEFELSSSMVQILIASANHLFLFTI